jgi:hypothetical protein
MEKGDAMKRWLILLLLLGNCSGCGLMEDLVLGPDPHLPDFSAAAQPSSTCANPAANVNASQTNEPELLQARK